MTRSMVIHHSITDPVYAEGDPEARRLAFRQAREEIRTYLVNDFIPMIKRNESAESHSQTFIDGGQ